ncbi:hypothetical protein QTO34_014254 [Cnephaeus nilssonii]|uniref:Uncharacterized protein n=1 Tax=Cnephaeus nilssonii TaxID=3371016 RepID=A0AA40I6V3_CNENI|nr:hypothetical protein QTO34_014254 [Eptesicus nilssonii]
MTQTLSSRCQWRRELSVLLAQSATPATLSPAPCASCWPNRGRSGVMRLEEKICLSKKRSEKGKVEIHQKGGKFTSHKSHASFRVMTKTPPNPCGFLQGTLKFNMDPREELTKLMRILHLDPHPIPVASDNRLLQPQIAVAQSNTLKIKNGKRMRQTRNSLEMAWGMVKKTVQNENPENT